MHDAESERQSPGARLIWRTAILQVGRRIEMGLVVGGTISGKLPEQVAFAVNYPGYPSSVSRAIETLGGEEGLAKVSDPHSRYSKTADFSSLFWTSSVRPFILNFAAFILICVEFSE